MNPLNSLLQSTGSASRRKASENATSIFRKTVADLSKINHDVIKDMEVQEEIIAKAVLEKDELEQVYLENNRLISNIERVLNVDNTES